MGIEVPHTFVELPANGLDFRDFPCAFKLASVRVVLHVALRLSGFHKPDSHVVDLVPELHFSILLIVSLLVAVEELPVRLLRPRLELSVSNC